MSLRCLLVLNLSPDNIGKILLFRQFPTVEKRCKLAYGNDYVPLPPPTIFANKLLVRLALSADSKQYVEWRDKADGNMQLPVVEITMDKKQLWPVVAVAEGNFLVCCLPFVEDKNTDTKNLLKISSISVGFSVLLGILNYLTMADRLTCLIDLDNYLTLSMPFGTPSDTEFCSLPYLQKFHSQKFSKRQPAWKPFDYKGKQQIYFKILEIVRSVQSDQSGGICHLETFGQISVKADVEGTLNDVTISLLSTDVGHPLSLDSVIIHPCVNVHGPSTISSGIFKRLRFSPPLHEFVMLQYCSPLPKEPPIQGVFKMLGENSIELLIQLKLHEKVKNSFDFCDLTIKFFNKGPVKNMEFNVNHGSPKLSEDKHSLKWILGTKFPKDLEAVLTAKLEFLDKPILSNNDPFCVDKNCYAQINFKQSNSTLSGCSIDPKSVTVSEGNKPKIVVERSVQSAEYRIWNNYGDVPFPVKIASKFNAVFT
ncbi:AP-5 complex subunit mu-1 [Trichonephila clavipes]|nr:AP-5 complex subunit mu-1 [Trichonephila clavipes]